MQFYSKNVEIPENFKEYAKKKISKAMRFCEKCGEARVEFEEDARHNSGEFSKKVEITIYIPRDVIRIEEMASDFREAIDLAVPKLKIQIDKYKKKQESIARRNGRKFKQALKSAVLKIIPWIKKGEYIPEFEIVKRKEFSIAEPLSESKAIAEMEKLRHDFFAFIDSESGGNSIVYKRRDGKYGVIKLKL